MANNIPCAICDWTETAHDMAVVYRKKGWYPQCRHKYVSKCDTESAVSTDRRRPRRKRR